MEVRHLKYFVAVAEELNFTNAAKRLNISQPPLSQQIKQLEESIGVQLLVRSNRKVELTDSGRALLVKAYNILEEIEKARDYTRNIFKGESRKISIGFSETALHDLISIIQLYKSVNSDVEISIHRMSTSDQITALNEDNIDIGLICTPVDIKNLNILPIRKQEFEIVLPKTHNLLQTTETIRLQNLKNDTFIVPFRKVSPAYYDAIFSVFNKLNFIPDKTITAYHSTVIMALVSSGLGVALIPSFMKYLFNNDVQFRKIEVTPIIETSLVWRYNDKSNTVDSIISLIKEFIYENQ